MTRSAAEKKAPEKRPSWLSRFQKNPTGQTVLGAVLGAVATLLVTGYFGPHPPDPAPLTGLVQSEAQLVLAEPRGPREADYGALFTEDCWIVDVAAQKFWRGRAQVLDRFRSLERFDTLQHVVAEDPVFDSESTAMVRTTSRVSLIEPATGMERSYSGKELWTFQKSGGRWRISSFQYNVP